MFESFILAGGNSSRMKRDKAFLKLGDQTFLGRSISTLEDINSKNIFIVLAENSDKFENFPVITDIYKDRGTLGGIHSALANCDEEYALIIACDYPFVSAELLNCLLVFAKEANSDCVAPIQKDGIIQPLCAIYKTENCLEMLTSIFEDSDKTPAAREFLKVLDTKFIEFEEIEHLPNSEHFFFNVNTPEDLKIAKEIDNPIK